MINTLVGIALIAAIASIAVGWIHIERQKRARHREIIDGFRSELLRNLQKRGPRALHLDELVVEWDIPEKTVNSITGEVFESTCRQVYQDAVVTDAERAYLNLLQSALLLPEAAAKRIEEDVKNKRYRQTANTAMVDGVITEAEKTELKRLRQRFAITDAQAARIVSTDAANRYVEVFREVIRDGRITREEVERLRDFREAFQLSRNKANELIQRDALGLYRQWVCNIVQDGEVTAEEEQGLAFLRAEFGLETAATERYDRQVHFAKQLDGYRKGQLPKVQTSKILESGEVCHWEGRCQFEWRTTRKTNRASGELCLSSNQIMFISPQRSFTFSPAKIVDVILYSNAVAIQTSSHRGSGTYFLDNSHIIEAMITGLTKKHKLLLTASGFSTERSRRIPDGVRREVYFRDGGKCVKCGADYPIHYGSSQKFCNITSEV